MNSKQRLELNDDWQSNTVCSESGTYCCKLHPGFEIKLSKGDIFPNCNQNNSPHTTIWRKFIS